jgi:hypothetical protein
VLTTLLLLRAGYAYLTALRQQKDRLEKKIAREQILLGDLPELSVQILELCRERGRATIGDAPDLESHQKSGAHFRAQANFSVRSSFFNAASALSASDLLAKACVPSTRTGGLERVNFAPLPLQ